MAPRKDVTSASATPRTMEHLLLCPALVKEHLHLKQQLDAKLIFWGIPYSSTPTTPRDRELRNRWRSAARELFTPDDISDSRLEILLKGFYKTNKSKPFISTRQLLENLSELLHYRRSSPCYHLRQDLLVLLIQAFSLQSQGLTDSWSFSPLFGDWTSINSYDEPFGGKRG